MDSDKRETELSVSSVTIGAASVARLLAPVPRVAIATRMATMADLPFMDSLQKKHGKQLGYFPTKQFEGYIGMGGVLIAEEVSGPLSVVSGENNGQRATDNGRAQPLGYCISKDRYLKRDELGVIYQLCVAPGFQRGLIGASLVREVFARSAYGCRLYCCWCAQDLDANYFWESLGFVPIAFRAGSTGKKRVHIFWQRRIDRSESSTTHQSPYWYPFQTSSGAIREDRIVFPIPPGVHWRDVKAVQVPSVARASRPCLEEKPDMGGTPMPRKRADRAPARAPLPHQVGILVGGRIKYVAKPGYVEPAAATALAKAAQKAKRERKPKEKPPKFDPKFLAAAREFRDRYL